MEIIETPVQKFTSWPKDYRKVYLELGKLNKELEFELNKSGLYIPKSVFETSYYGRKKTLGEINWNEITDIEMRIGDVYLKKGDPKIIDWLLHDEIDVYFSSLAIDDLGPKTTPMNLNIEKMRGKKGEKLPLQEPQIYRNPEGKVPRYIDYWISLTKSKEKTRHAGEILCDIINDENFVKVTDMISSIKDPPVEIITTASKIILGLTAKYLSKVSDKQLLFTAGTLNKKIDNLGVGRTFEIESDYASLKLQVKIA
ncbi:MAG: hypothetical protein QW051_02480 [Candidatus Aenigmatarchaeota archaeon]